MKIYRRSEWGAAPPKRTPQRCAWLGRDLWVHHSEGQAPSGSIQNSFLVIRNIQSFHQGSARGWYDIGYAYLVDPQGRIFEGRGYQVWAAHCPGHNGEPSVCLLGSYGTIQPTVEARNAVWDLARYLGMTHLRGHREGYATTCPGDAAMRYIVNQPMRPHAEKPDPKVLPYGGTLRLFMQTAAEKRAGRKGRTWAGWKQCEGALRWIKKNGIKPNTNCAISWRGNVWHGSDDVADVATTLVNRYLK